MDVKHAAERIGISEQAVRKNCATGRLEADDPTGTLWLISRTSVEQLAYAKENR